MNVALAPELAELVHKKIESGLYQSVNEVFREALRLLDERDRLDQMRLEELRRDVAIGLEQADRGELLDGPAVFEELREMVNGGDARP